MKGFLISDNMTYEPGANKYRKGLEKEGIFIKSYSDLLAEARRYNDDLYKMYEDISMKKNNKSDIIQENTFLHPHISQINQKEIPEK